MGTSYKKLAGIYQIRNLSNGKVYIGYSERIGKRWANHRNKLRKGTHINIHLQSAWNKYGEESFIFSIIEPLSIGLEKEEYEAIETKWVLYLKSHLSEFGYNGCLPGSIPLKSPDSNKCKIGNGRKNDPKINFICINLETKEVFEKIGYKNVSELTTIPYKKVGEYATYWVNNSGRKRSHKNWIVINKINYNPNFNYIDYNPRLKNGPKKTWRDYEKTRKRNKNKQ